MASVFAETLALQPRKCVPAMKLGGDSMGGCGICRADARSLAKKFELVGVDDMVSRPGGRSW